MPTDEQFRQLVLDAPDVVAILEADLTVRFVCRSVSQALGFSPEEVEGSNLGEYLDPGEPENVFLEFKRHPGEAADAAARTFEVGLRHKDGFWRRFEASVVGCLEDLSFRGIAVYLRDVTERKAQKEQLAHRALHDPLTGLPNRALFLNRLSQALDAAAREREPVAILFLDLDGFKGINDSYGHVAGDRLLVALGQRMRSCLRPGDTIARLGGDEFAVLIEEAARDAEAVADRLKEALRAPVDVEGGSVRVSASVGIVKSSEVPGGDRPEDLLRAADAATYRVKRARRSPDEGTSKDRARLGPEGRLRRALEREEFGLHYQACSPPGTRRIACMEALLRLEDSEFGGLPPQEVIDLAERSNMLAPLGHWILTEVCSQALSWRVMWPDTPPLVSVRVSPGQFPQVSLSETVDAALREIGLGPEALVLVIATKEALLEGDAYGAERKLERPKTLGVKIAIDHFAPGAAGLLDFERLPVDYLEFERSLVGELGRGKKYAGLLVSLYTGLAQARGHRRRGRGRRELPAATNAGADELRPRSGFLPVEAATRAPGDAASDGEPWCSVVNKRLEREPPTSVVSEPREGAGMQMDGTKTVRSDNPWGYSSQYAHNIPCTVRLITVQPGGTLPRQYHGLRDALWVVLDPGAEIELGGVVVHPAPSEELYIPRGTMHVLSCVGERPTRILEISFGACDKGDAARLRDARGRADPANDDKEGVSEAWIVVDGRLQRVVGI